jgi:hypothetical protein
MLFARIFGANPPPAVIREGLVYDEVAPKISKSDVNVSRANPPAATTNLRHASYLLDEVSQPASENLGADLERVEHSRVVPNRIRAH